MRKNGTARQVGTDMVGYNPRGDTLQTAGTIGAIGGAILLVAGIAAIVADRNGRNEYARGYNDSMNAYRDMKGGANVNING